MRHAEHKHTAKALEHLHRAGYAAGGKVHGDAKMDAAMVKKAMHEHDMQLHHGTTKLHLARGGAAKHKGGTKVNVIVAPQGQGAPHPVPVPVPAAGAPMGGPPRPPMAPPGAMPPRPGMGAPPMMGPPGGVAMRPPGMKRGGWVKKRADGGDVSSKRDPQTYSTDDTGGAPVFSKDWDDSKDKSAYDKVRPKQARGGALKELARVHKEEGKPRRAAGGPAMSAGNKRHVKADRIPDNVDMFQEKTEAKRGGSIKRARGGGVKMDAGSGGGLGRLEKIKAYGGRARG